MKPNSQIPPNPDDESSLTFNMMTISCLASVFFGYWILESSGGTHTLLSCLAGWYFLLVGSAGQVAIHRVRFRPSPLRSTTDD